jgi:hypothetical protein
MDIYIEGSAGKQKRKFFWPFLSRCKQKAAFKVCRQIFALAFVSENAAFSRFSTAAADDDVNFKRKLTSTFFGLFSLTRQLRPGGGGGWGGLKLRRSLCIEI